MAKTFYKYGERQPITYVDWSEVGRNFTDMLEGQVAARESKKAEIKKTMDEQMEFIQDNPLGGITGNDKFSFNLAQSGQEWHTIVNKNMQAGLINYNDAMFLTQNTTNQTEKFYNLLKTYNARGKEIEDDIASGSPKISNLTKGQLMTIEGLNKFDNLMPIIDMQGNINAVEYDIVDGKQVTKNSYTVKQLELLTNSNIGIFDAVGSAQSIANSFGKLTESKFHEAVKAGGMGLTITEVNNYSNSQLKEKFGVSGSEAEEFRSYASMYLEAEEAKIKALANPINTGSFLVDFLEAEGYEVTTNLKQFENQAYGNFIFAQGTDIRTTEEQDKVFMDKMRVLVRTATDKSVTEKATSRRPIPKVADGSKGNEGFTNPTLQVYASKIFSGAKDDTEVEENLRLFEAAYNAEAIRKGKPYIILDNDDSGVYGKFSDGTPINYPFFDQSGNSFGQKGWTTQFLAGMTGKVMPINQPYIQTGGDVPDPRSPIVSKYNPQGSSLDKYKEKITADILGVKSKNDLESYLNSILRSKKSEKADVDELLEDVDISSAQDLEDVAMRAISEMIAKMAEDDQTQYAAYIMQQAEAYQKERSLIDSKRAFKGQYLQEVGRMFNTSTPSFTEWFEKTGRSYDEYKLKYKK